MARSSTTPTATGPSSTPKLRMSPSTPSFPAPSTAPAKCSRRRFSPPAVKRTGAKEAMIASGMSDEDAAKACISVRTDGKSGDIDGDYAETLARIDGNANGVGVFGLAFYENNTDKLKVATMSGIAPSTETIAARRLSGVASALLLRREGAYRRHPRPEGIRPGLRLRRDRRSRWAARPVWPGRRSGTCQDPGGSRSPRPSSACKPTAIGRAATLAGGPSAAALVICTDAPAPRCPDPFGAGYFCRPGKGHAVRRLRSPHPSFAARLLWLERRP